jgi:hypothetical protein
MNTFNTYTCCLCMYNCDTVCGEASHGNGSCYEIFYYLHYSNDAGLL